MFSKDLLDADDWNFYILRGGSTESQYKQTNNAIFRGIWHKYLADRPDRLLSGATEMKSKLEPASTDVNNVIQLSSTFVANSPTFSDVLCQIQVTKYVKYKYKIRTFHVK